MSNVYPYRFQERKRVVLKTAQFILILGAGVFVTTVLYHSLFVKQQSLVVPIVYSKENSFNFSDSGLYPIVAQDLKDQKGDFAIVVEQLTPDAKEEVFINDTKVMPAGSLYKLFLIAATLRQEEQGKLHDSDTITASVDHLVSVLGSQEYGYEDYKDDTLSYSVADTLTRIATISDNYAAIMLAEKVGWANVQKEADLLGAKSTKIKAPISTTATDIALFFKKLYQKEVVSSQASDRIIDLLKQARINNRIPAGVPGDVEVAHKTGELDGVRNDAGIVFFDDKPYIMVLMSNNLPFEDDGITVLANISKDVYTYFSSR